MRLIMQGYEVEGDEGEEAEEGEEGEEGVIYLSQ